MLMSDGSGLEGASNFRGSGFLKNFGVLMTLLSVILTNERGYSWRCPIFLIRLQQACVVSRRLCDWTRTLQGPPSSSPGSRTSNQARGTCERSQANRV